MNIWLKITVINLVVLLVLLAFAPAGLALGAVFCGFSYVILGTAIFGRRSTPALTRYLDQAEANYEAQVERAKAFDAKGHSRWLK